MVGKLTFYQSKWSELFPQFLEIIREVSQGLLIAFSDDTPSLLSHPLELLSNNKTLELLQALKMLLESRAIKEVFRPIVAWLLQSSVSGPQTRRVVLSNHRPQEIEPLPRGYPSFKMETLFSIIAALQPLEWITKIDLKDAYHHILVHQNIRKYFGYVIDGKTYQFQILPFGLSMAPREFTKTLTPLVQLLRTRGISESTPISTIG